MGVERGVSGGGTTISVPVLYFKYAPARQPIYVVVVVDTGLAGRMK